MEEKTFLTEEGVTVTSARFIVPSQTYAMSGIVSVKTREDTPSRSGPIFCGIAGFGCLLLAATDNSLFAVVAAILILFAIIWLASQETVHHLVLTTASGEARAFASRDAPLVARVAAALNDSIVWAHTASAPTAVPTASQQMPPSKGGDTPPTGIACGKCGARRDAGESFCGRCGTALPPKPQGRTCPTCRREWNHDDEFCGRCGTGLSAA